MTRYPAVAGRFYPSDREDLLSIIESSFYHDLGPGRIPRSENSGRIKSVIVPHAGYLASGMIAAHSFSALAENGAPEAYVIIGPDHYGIPYDFAVCPEAYLTPLGECQIHEEILEKLNGKIPMSVAAHRKEHSVEVIVPFIQYIHPDAKIIPIIMRNQSYASAEKLSKILKEACAGYDVITIASTDLSHYIPDSLEKTLDAKYLQNILDNDIKEMYRTIQEYNLSVCGNGPVVAMMMFTDFEKAELLKHSNSWESLECDRNGVVGYASVIFS